jgi:hypothetical protein
VRELLGASLRNFEIAFLKIGEEVTAREILHNDVNVILVFEDIEEADDVGVLAHLENLDLSPL